MPILAVEYMPNKSINKMKNKTTFINSLAFFFFVCLIFNSCTQGPIDVTSEITEANKGFMEAFNNGDANALAKTYTSNAKLYPPNSDVIEGQEAIEGFWNTAMNMGIKETVLETVTAESYGNIAIEEGRYKNYDEGDKLVSQGKYIVTWKKEDGQWKLHRDIWNTSNPAPQPRASLNDTVWVILNRIKADKLSQFEDFYFNYLEPAAAEYTPQKKKTIRALKPVEQNEDGTYTYVELMDPVISTEYAMMVPLTAKYGEEKAAEYFKMFVDCLKDGKQEMIVTVQTAW